MESLYPNVKKGLLYLIIASAISIIGSVCYTVFDTFSEQLVFKILTGVSIGILLAGLVVGLIGIITAGKDNSSHFTEAMFEELAVMLFALLAICFAFTPVAFLVFLSALFMRLLPLIELFLVIDIVLGCNQVTNGAVSNIGRALLIFSVVMVFVELIAGNFWVFLMNAQKETSATTTAIVFVCITAVAELAMEIFYIIFLNKTRKNICNKQ